MSFIIMKDFSSTELGNQSSFLNVIPTLEPTDELALFWICHTAAASKCACVGLQAAQQCLHSALLCVCISSGLSLPLLSLKSATKRACLFSPLCPCFAVLKTNLHRFYYLDFCLVFVFLSHYHLCYCRVECNSVYALNTY